MTLVPLEPPVTTSMPWNPSGWPRRLPLKKGPAYARGRTATRWHRVRSGTFRPAFVSDREDLGNPAMPASTTYSLWCGPSLFHERCLTAPAPYPDEPVCGVCEGKVLGVSPDHPGLLHTPTNTLRKLPKWCPGSGPSGLWEPVPDPRGYPRVARCLVCGALEGLRGMGGAYRWTVGIVKHQPLELVPGCPFHAWRHLEIVDGRAVCRCGHPGGWS